MRVRGVGRDGLPFEEATSSDDVSRGGCSFHTAHDLEVGSELELEILRRNGAGRAPTPFLTTGVVRRLIKVPPDQCILAIEFIGPQFPTFVSESTAGD